MANPLNRVLEVLATATAADLQCQAQFRRAENQILGSKSGPAYGQASTIYPYNSATPTVEERHLLSHHRCADSDLPAPIYPVLAVFGHTPAPVIDPKIPREKYFGDRTGQLVTPFSHCVQVPSFANDRRESDWSQPAGMYATVGWGRGRPWGTDGHNLLGLWASRGNGGRLYALIPSLKDV
jgi:hypothetical protein